MITLPFRFPSPPSRSPLYFFIIFFFFKKNYITVFFSRARASAQTPSGRFQRIQKEERKKLYIYKYYTLQFYRLVDMLSSTPSLHALHPRTARGIYSETKPCGNIDEIPVRRGKTDEKLAYNVRKSSVFFYGVSCFPYYRLFTLPDTNQRLNFSGIKNKLFLIVIYTRNTLSVPGLARVSIYDYVAEKNEFENVISYFSTPFISVFLIIINVEEKKKYKTSKKKKTVTAG